MLSFAARPRCFTGGATSLVTTTPLRDWLLADLEPEPLEAGETLKVCAWCTRFFGADQVWHPTRDLLNLFSQNRITHGLCPECHDQFLER